MSFLAKDNRSTIGSSWGRLKLNPRARCSIGSCQGGWRADEGGELTTLQHEVCQAQIGNIVRLALKDLRPDPTESTAQGADSFRAPGGDVSLLWDSRSGQGRAIVATHVDIQTACGITVCNGGRPGMQYYQLRAIMKR